MAHPFHKAHGILQTLEQSGHEAFFVGGCVRDWLLQRPIGDIDIATSAKPHEVQNLFPKVIPVGIEHGTVIVRHEGDSYEVTTFRMDGHYSDQRRPDTVHFVTSLEADLRRRDFTINALAMDREGNIIDLFKGRQDIQARQIRTVGNGYERFQEDALRIIRGLRFSSQLGFSIAAETLRDMIDLKDRINCLAVERIRAEMEKLLSGDFVQVGITYCLKTGVGHHLPVFRDHPDLFEEMATINKPLSSFAEFIAFCHYKHPEHSIQKWTKEWKASNRTKYHATVLSDALLLFAQEGLNAWLVYQLSHDLLEPFIRLNHMLQEECVSFNDLQTMKNKLQIHSKSDLALGGKDLMQIFPEQTPGPWLKETLQQLEKHVVMNDLKNDKHTLEEWIRCHPPGKH